MLGFKLIHVTKRCTSSHDINFAMETASWLSLGWISTKSIFRGVQDLHKNSNRYLCYFTKNPLAKGFNCFQPFTVTVFHMRNDVIKFTLFPRYWPFVREFSGEFPSQRPVTRSFDVFFDLRLNEQLSEQSWGWWFETLSCPLWRHCNATMELPNSHFFSYSLGTLVGDKSLASVK